MELQKLTPLMQQYWEIKNQHLDKILLFRMGDFYEMFFEDAIKAAPLLNIALTSRSKSQGKEVPMCGVPYHAVAPQINKLLSFGLKVALCEQVETVLEKSDPKAIVKRAVTRVVTPGLVYDPDMAAPSDSLYVASFKLTKGEGTKELYDFCALDASTGEVLTAVNLAATELSSWIQKLAPKEFVLEKDQGTAFHFSGVLTTRENPTNLSCTDFLLNYVAETQGKDVTQTLKGALLLQNDFLRMSPATIRHLELLKTSMGELRGSFFETINFTKSPMGARLLKKRILTPFAELKEIQTEQHHVHFFLKEEKIRSEVRTLLRDTGDLERKIGRLSNSLCNARDLKALEMSLSHGFEILEKTNSVRSPMKNLASLISKLSKTLQDSLPHSTKDGNLVKTGFNPALDELVELATHSQVKLTELETNEKVSSGISNLKIKYSSVFGYAFEVTQSNLSKVPKHFIRKQTLAQAERFATEDLTQLEVKILSSQQKRCDLEFQIFNDLKKECLALAGEMLEVSDKLALIDVRSGFSELAFQQNYSAPIFQLETIDLKKSRHPVLERISQDVFIPNDLVVHRGECILLTGPNMAGKSTLMRQLALTAVLAQCGSFVPASEARLPIFDQIFTRIGASDHLIEGLSTFMVEMKETADIISNATSKSLVILDEIGRGTSTYDGMSLAHAVLEYFINTVGSYTLFATHYHELTELNQELPKLVNKHMAIQEHKGELIFLRKLVEGSASRSYGIEVAKKAGLPKELTSRAQIILKGIACKTKGLKNKQLDFLDGEGVKAFECEEELESLRAFSKNIMDLKIEALSPLEALNHLAHFQKSLQ